MLDCLLEGNKCEGRGELMQCAINWLSDFWSPFLLPCPGKARLGQKSKWGIKSLQLPSPSSHHLTHCQPPLLSSSRESVTSSQVAWLCTFPSFASICSAQILLVLDASYLRFTHSFIYSTFVECIPWARHWTYNNTGQTGSHHQQFSIRGNKSNK